MRLGAYGVASTVLAGVTLQQVYMQRGNFYAAGVYLAKSNACLLILLNFGVFLTIVLGKALQWLFFGQLRAIEVEHLYERSWFAVTETCLAMTVFRDDFDVPFLAAFAALLFVKIFHWLLQDRVEFMDQTAQLPSSFHTRTLTLLALLSAIDMELIAYAVRVTLSDGVGTWLLFGFEYTILLCTVVTVTGRYALNVIEMRMGEEAWEEKSVFLFYLELIIDFIKLVAYVSFFTLLVALHGLPLHIIRDLYVTARSFFRRCGDLRRYRRATQDMERRYPTLTSDDLTDMADRVCVVCREEMTLPPPIGGNINNGLPDGPADTRYRLPGDLPKRLPCGHTFHFRCLRSWLERQQSCPTCRRSVLEENNPRMPDIPQRPIGRPVPAQPEEANNVQAQLNPLQPQQHRLTPISPFPAAHTDQYTTQATNAATDGATMVGHQSLNSLDSEMSAQARESAQKEAAEIAAQLNLSEQATCTFMSEFTFLAETGFSPNDATIARLYRLSQDIADDDGNTNVQGSANMTNAQNDSTGPRHGPNRIIEPYTRLDERMERLEGLLEQLLLQQQQQQQQQSSS